MSNILNVDSDSQLKIVNLPEKMCSWYKDGRDIGRSVSSINPQQFCRGHSVSTGFIKLCRSRCKYLWLRGVNLLPWMLQMKSNIYENILFINFSSALFVFIYFLLQLIILCFWMPGTVSNWNIYYNFIIITYIEITELTIKPISVLLRHLTLTDFSKQFCLEYTETMVCRRSQTYRYMQCCHSGKLTHSGTFRYISGLKKSANWLDSE